jgi:uncharacterized membrane protein YoaT (DUF817 family)
MGLASIRKMCQNRPVKLGVAVIVLSMALFAIGYVNIDFCWPITAVVIGILCGCYLVMRPRTPSAKVVVTMTTVIAGCVITVALGMLTFIVGFAHHWLFYPLTMLLIIVPTATVACLVCGFLLSIRGLLRRDTLHTSNNHD